MLPGSSTYASAFRPDHLLSNKVYWNCKGQLLYLISHIVFVSLPIFGFSLQDVVRVICEEFAKLSRLSHRRGKIAIGMDADFVLWDPD